MGFFFPLPNPLSVDCTSPATVTVALGSRTDSSAPSFSFHCLGAWGAAVPLLPPLHTAHPSFLSIPRLNHHVAPSSDALPCCNYIPHVEFNCKPACGQGEGAAANVWRQGRRPMEGYQGSGVYSAGCPGGHTCRGSC